MRAYIRETMAELDARYDREAVWLICSAGVFSPDDPSKINDAVDRCRGESSTQGDKVVRLRDRLKATHATKQQEDLFAQLENVLTDELLESVDAAYLLGIAVGRRLGSHALTAGGAR